MTRALLFAVAMFCLAGSALADGMDQPPRGVDLDLGPASRAAPLRVRWFFDPSDAPAAEAAVSEQRAGVERIAILTLFDDRWILEAPADSVVRVEAEFGALGTLQADESGVAALNTARVLVGLDDDFLPATDLEGDVTSTVAILDSGCDTAHDDLGDPDGDNADGYPDAGDAGDWEDATALLSGDLGTRVVGWHDVTDDLPLAVGPWDDHLHGTAMASAGFGGGRIDPLLKGVAPEGRFVVVKTWNFEGRWERWASDFFLGVEWVLANAQRLRVQACVVGTVWDLDHGFAAAVDALREAGILLIAPVGNRPVAGWPARVPESFGVGAATNEGLVADYSAAANLILSPPVLDVVAPGGSMSVPGGGVLVADNEPNDTYRERTGTSIAAAMVGGAVSLIAEVARESGYAWPEGPARVDWLTDLISQTSVELAAGEPALSPGPVLNRGGVDWFEGYGLIQVPAAVQSINNILWPGDRADFELSSPTEGRAAWAARIPGSAPVPTSLSLIPAAEIDADLFVFEDTGSSWRPLASSVRAGRGVAEAVELSLPSRKDLIVVARRVSGFGPVIFSSVARFGPSSLWPRELRSRQTSQPVAVDLDGDGAKEVVLTNTFAVDKSVHEFVVFDARGGTFRFFPRSVDSSPYTGSLSAPVAGRVGTRRLIVAGSDFGLAFGVTDSSLVLFKTPLTPGVAISAPVLWQEGEGARLLFGSQSGVQVLTAAGAVERIIPLGSPVSGDLAVGDLDGDGSEEILVVSQDREVHAFEIDGAPLPGWPQSLAGEPGAPVLVGRVGQPGVERVLFLEETGSGELLLHDRGVDGQPRGASPHTLDRSGVPLRDHSALAAARRPDGRSEVVVGAVLGNWSGDQVYRVWRFVPETGTVGIQDLVYSPQHLEGMLQLSRGLVVDEPRLVEFSARPGLELLQAVQLDWSETFVGNPRRYGSSRQVYQWSEASAPLRFALAEGHTEFPEVWAMTPLVTDLEGDGYPDLIVVRDNRVYRSGVRVRTGLDEFWGGERAGRTRSACLDCDGPGYVAAPAAPRSSRITVSPNPFNPRTELIAEIPAAGPVQWAVFDARGRRVRRWSEQVAAPGQHRSVFDGRDQAGERLASGVYFVQLAHAGGTARSRMVLVR